MAIANVEDFLLENVGSPITTKKVHLKRFKTDFEIKSLNAEETTELRKQATRKVLNKKTHQYEQDTDQNKFIDLVLTKSVVFPDLDNAKLQESWSCPGDPAKLLKRMLTMGEYNELSQAIMDLSGLDTDSADDLEETAKN